VCVRVCVCLYVCVCVWQKPTTSSPRSAEDINSAKESHHRRAALDHHPPLPDQQGRGRRTSFPLFYPFLHGPTIRASPALRADKFYAVQGGHAKSALLGWVQSKIPEYNIRNFTTGIQLALRILLHYRPFT
jgi:hypothetical protein